MHLSGAEDLTVFFSRFKINKVAQQGGYMNLFFIDAHYYFFFAPSPPLTLVIQSESLSLEQPLKSNLGFMHH